MGQNASPKKQNKFPNKDNNNAQGSPGFPTQWYT